MDGWLTAHWLRPPGLQVDAKGRAQKDKEFGKTEKNAEDSLPDDAPRALAAFYQKGRK